MEGFCGLATTSVMFRGPKLTGVMLVQLSPPSIDCQSPPWLGPLLVNCTAAKTTFELLGLTAMAPNATTENKFWPFSVQVLPPSVVTSTPPLGPLAAAYRV